VPTDLWEDRDGRVITICEPDDVYQENPAGMTSKQHAPWQALEEMAYTYVPEVYGFEPPTREENYAWTTAVRHVGYGQWQHSSRVQHPFKWQNMLSFWRNPWQKMLPDDPPILPSPIDLIPADAWIEEVRFEVKYCAHPTEYVYAVHEFGHNNTLLPQSTTIIPGAVLESEYESGEFDIPPFDGDDGFNFLRETVVVPAGTINARNAIMQDFNLWITLRHESYTGAKFTAPVLLRIAWAVMDIRWRGIDTEAIDQWDGAYYNLADLSMAGTIERQRNMEANIAANLAATASVNFIGGLAGSMAADLDGIADPTKDVGGVNDSTDTSGFFYGGLGLDASPVGHFRMDGTAAMSFSAAATINRITDMSGTFDADDGTWGAQLLKEGRLWVDEESLVMSMTLGASAGMSGTYAMTGAMACSLSLTSDLTGQMQLAGAPIFSLSSASSYIGKTVDMAGAPGFSMASTGQLVRQLDISGSYSADLSFWAGITYDVRSDSQAENTIYVGPKQNDVYVQPKGRTIYVGPRDRIVSVGQRDRTIYLDSQQRN
jgi:hypothetical protein